jgi:hypothetical protein
MHERSHRVIGRLFPASVVASLLVFAACDGDPEVAVSRRDCARLRDHLIELRMATVTADQDQHRATLEKVLGDSFISTCVEQTDVSDLRCSLAATDEHSLGVCSSPDR